MRVGQLIAERAKAAGVEAVVFDRGGNTYGGRIARWPTPPGERTEILMMMIQRKDRMMAEQSGSAPETGAPPPAPAPTSSAAGVTIAAVAAIGSSRRPWWPRRARQR